ncbi:MAG: histidinol dehydrogenase, partial [Thermoplasmata archaeon]|nr:histidinol dehydrogenase [Thermoplasmata archaeon]
SGTNHVLPTKGYASMRSTLSTYDFTKIIPYQCISESGARKLAPIVFEVAMSEGLPAHAKSATSRAGRVTR